MSFLSTLENDGKKVLAALETGLKFAINESPLVGEAVGLFNPAAGALISMIGTKVIQAEAQITGAKTGAQKKAYVTANLMDALTLAFTMIGKSVPTEALAAVSSAIDAFVALLNSVNQVPVKS